ncbi:MAG: Chromosome partition protein Smc [Chlamydiae bacterium]|nr:Chromosome partition protein Smc [Chlamydiota bacterium]
MLKTFKEILEVQELDMKMIRLLRLRNERQKELSSLNKLRQDLENQAEEKRQEITSLEKEVEGFEQKIELLKERLKQLDQQQSIIKKVDEFNALTQEMSHLDKERTQKEQHVSDLTDRMNMEKEVLEKIEQSLKESYESSKEIEKEIFKSIDQINKEGKELKDQRDVIAQKADTEFLSIYNKLLANKRDRVVVPIENRTCSGCHITLTPQHENLVRKQEKLAFCEHCSRIHYWQEQESKEEGEPTTKRRRRRAAIIK